MTTDADNDNGNGRVTIAKLGVKLDHVMEQQTKLIDRIDRHLEQANARDVKLVALDVWRSSTDKFICDQAAKLDEVRISSARNDRLSVIAAAAFSAIAAWFGGTR